MTMSTDPKNQSWQMRMDKTDRKNFARLQKQLGVKSQAEAVRFAVTMAIQIMSQPQPVSDPRPIVQEPAVG